MGQRCARSVIIILTFLRLKDEKISLYYYCFDRTRLFWPNTQSHLQGLNKLFLLLIMIGYLVFYIYIYIYIYTYIYIINK